ncbi:MAG TPA: hypothetical protein VM369_10160 [Candidatus Binatia bacterium]|nr:hypothetical protein [Candidatus Binatia bacterium]
MKERAIQFGPGRELLGILTLPDVPDPARPAVLLPNTGVEHRVGPNRLHVHLARACARLGLVCLRLDLSGMGDSGQAGARADPVADLREAMNHLERMGLARRFVPIGLCSGGHDAHQLAKAEPRVVAAAFIDHYQYRTPRAFAIHLWQRVSEPRRLLNFARRKWREACGRGEAEYRSELVSYFQEPPRAEFCADLGRFMQRRMPLFFLYTGAYQHLYNYRDQLLDVCPALAGYPLHALHYLPHCDHTFTHASMRAQGFAAMEDWLLNQVLPETAGAVRVEPAAAESMPAHPLPAVARAQ